MLSFRRTTVSVLAVAAALLTTTGAAGAATTSNELYGEAAAASLDLDLFDTVTMTGATAHGVVSHTGEGLASGLGLDALDGTASSAQSTTSTVVADPDDGMNCATPELPAPLDQLPVGVACSAAYASGGALPTAEAFSSIGDISANGAVLGDLVSFLVDNVGADVAAALDAAVEPLEEFGGELYGPVIDGLAEQCNEALAALLEASEDVSSEVVTPVQDMLENDPTGLADSVPVTELVQELNEANEVMPAACQELLELTSQVPSIEALLEDVAAALDAALADLTLLELEVGGSKGSVVTTADTVTSTSATTLVRLEVPGLGPLTATVEELLDALVASAVGSLSESLSEEFRDLVPLATDIVGGALDALELPALLDGDDPLLVLEVLPASATSTVTRATSVVETSGTGATATLTLAEALGAILGTDQIEVEVPAGDTITVLEGTPLASTVSLNDPQPVSRDVDGLPVEGTSVAGASLDLLQGVNGGVVIALSTVEAVTGAEVLTVAAPDPETAPAPEPEAPDLPRTGGGAALLALPLGLAALAVRRRD